MKIGEKGRLSESKHVARSFERLKEVVNRNQVEGVESLAVHFDIKALLSTIVFGLIVSIDGSSTITQELRSEVHSLAI